MEPLEPPLDLPLNLQCPCSVLAITCPFYTENGCTHTPIALAVFGTKLFRTLKSRKTHIGVGSGEGERWHFLALWQK